MRTLYGCRNRPPGYASVPKGWEKASHPGFQWAISYAAPLTDDECRSYELMRILTIHEEALLAAKVALEVPYLDEWVEMLNGDESEVRGAHAAIRDTTSKLAPYWHVHYDGEIPFCTRVTDLMRARRSLGF